MEPIDQFISNIILNLKIYIPDLNAICNQYTSFVQLKERLYGGIHVHRNALYQSNIIKDKKRFWYSPAYRQVVFGSSVLNSNILQAKK